MSKGKLIVIEGLDGSGKATQAKLLAQHLASQGLPVREVTFPDYASDSSALIKMYLAGQFGSKPDDVNAYAASSFFAVDRYASYKTDWGRFYEVAKGQVSPEDFMDGIEAMAAELVRKYSHISEDGQKLFQPEKETVGLCPRCGKPVYEGKKNFACSDRACQFVMWKNDRFWTSRRKEMTRKMAADLLKKGRASVKGMWSEKKGSTYDAVVILDDTGGKYVNFKLEFPKRKDGVHGKK